MIQYDLKWIHMHMYTENKYDRLNCSLIDSKHGAAFIYERNLSREKLFHFFRGCLWDESYLVVKTVKDEPS